MTAETVFSIANLVALLSWLVLLIAIWRRSRWWRDDFCGKYIPLGLSALYTTLIVFFFWRAPGGFDTLANVKMLFTSDWAALAGWVHYLAFDLFVGSWIARHWMNDGLPRWPLLAIMPATFMFGPVGLVANIAGRFLLSPQKDVQS